LIPDGLQSAELPGVLRDTALAMAEIRNGARDG
jgi:hypothetical protein